MHVDNAGSFTSCFVPTVPSWGGLDKPFSLAVSSDGSKLYVPSSNGNFVVTECVLASGTIASCATPTLTSGTWNLNQPFGISIIGDGAYLTNVVGDTVTRCQITGGPGGSITSCAVLNPTR